MSESRSDLLKEVHEILEPDERSHFFARHNPITNQPESLTLKDIHVSISEYAMHAGVPIRIREAFDVARNLYLYSWFVYRFRTVAEAHALSTLEYALREFIGKENIEKYKKERKETELKSTGKKLNLRNGLRLYIEYCRDHKLIKNENFTGWRRIPILRLEQQYQMQIFEKMRAEGVTEIRYEMPKFHIADDQNTFDYINHLVEHTHVIRNMHAHGNSMVYPTVLHTFEMVSEFVNQLY